MLHLQWISVAKDVGQCVRLVGLKLL